MTLPVTTEALVEAMAEALKKLTQSVLLAHDDYTRLGDYAGWNFIQSAESQLSKLLPTLFARLQQVTAERDEARAELARLRERLEIDHAYDGGGNKIPFPENMEHLDGIECRDETIRNLEEQVARLRAEREAKNRALMFLLPFVDYVAGEGLIFVETEAGEHPEMDAADIMGFAAQALGIELGSNAYLALLSAGYDAIRAARAATASEGQADG